jgi:hypothetical protein
VDNIAQLPGGTMTFRFTRRAPMLVTASSPDVLVRVNLVPYQRYEEIVAPSTSVAVAVDQQLTLLGGRTRATFLPWSDGGAREHTVIASPLRPDTLVATLAVEHRLLAVVSGTGTITADRPGTLLAGIFLPAGLSTTLTATAVPGTGAFFTGWSGDTTGSSPVMVLPMGRPYDMTATFTTTIPVSVVEATAGILGTASLSAEQRQQLDTLGNQNGYFGVGDYLSLLSRMGLVAGHAPAAGGARP